MSWCMITSNIASVGTRGNLLVSSEYLKNLNPTCWLVVGRTALTFFPLSSPFWSFKCNCSLVITNLSKDKQVLKPGNHEVNVIHDMVAKQDILYLLENFCAYTWLFMTPCHGYVEPCPIRRLWHWRCRAAIRPQWRSGCCWFFVFNGWRRTVKPGEAGMYTKSLSGWPWFYMMVSGSTRSSCQADL